MEHELNDLGQPLGPSMNHWKGCPTPPRELLTGRYCRLEPFDLARHAVDLFTANNVDNDGRMWSYLPYGPFVTLDEYQAWLEKTCTGDDPLFFTIVDEHTNRAVGLTSYLRITPEHGSIEIGHLAYSPAMQRSCISTEATTLLLRYAFTLGYRRVEWKCNALNAASRAAARRLGFSFEGLFRNHVILKGRNRDTAWYAITDGDWPAIDAVQQRWLDPANFDSAGAQRLSLSALTAPLRHTPEAD